jgi:AcrR family transcriptional regulator
MVRTVKEQEYTRRRNAILDAVNRLLYGKGYEQMTIQDVVSDLQISKGAFYHYFDSKQAAFSALLERMGQELDQHLHPIVHNPALSAINKLQHFFDTLARWKSARKAVLLAVTRIWYSDDNAIIRQQLRRARVKQLTPLLATIIAQGCQEGVLRTPYPDQMGEVVVSLILDMNDALGEILLSPDLESEGVLCIERVIAAYTQTLELALQAPKGSLHLVDMEILKEWLVESVDDTEARKEL